MIIDNKFYVSSSDQVKHTYQYDKQGRIISMTLLVNNQKFWEENYTYHEEGFGLGVMVKRSRKGKKKQLGGLVFK